jgi:DNA-binding LytR/AlgR family response regulator
MKTLDIAKTFLSRISRISTDEIINYGNNKINWRVPSCLRRQMRKLIVYLTIKSIAEQLPENIFLKIHKSTIININKIKSIEGNEIDTGKAKLTISQNLRETVMNEILKGKMIKR